MATERERLIRQLVEDAAPVPWWRRAPVLTGLWLVVTIAYVLVATAYHGPFRPGSLQQLIQSPMFLLETVVAGLAAITVAHFAFALGIPAGASLRKVLTVSTLAVLGWLAFYAYGLWEPALEPSMAGKRHLCYREVMVLSLPPLLLGLVLLRRLYPTRGFAAGAVLGAAAGLVPAITMQFACMYLVDHILTHHVAPVGAVALVGGLLGAIAFRDSERR